jgi:hypothetical protein
MRNRGNREGWAQGVGKPRRLILDPSPLLVVYHGAVALIEHPPAPGVHHDQAHFGEVAVEAPADSVGRPVNPVGELAQQGPGVVGVPDPLEELARGDFLGGEVPKVLVDPVDASKQGHGTRRADFERRRPRSRPHRCAPPVRQAAADPAARSPRKSATQRHAHALAGRRKSPRRSCCPPAARGP